MSGDYHELIEEVADPHSLFFRSAYRERKRLTKGGQRERGTSPIVVIAKMHMVTIGTYI